MIIFDSTVVTNTPTNTTTAITIHSTKVKTSTFATKLNPAITLTINIMMLANNRFKLIITDIFKMFFELYII